MKSLRSIKSISFWCNRTCFVDTPDVYRDIFTGRRKSSQPYSRQLGRELYALTLLCLQSRLDYLRLRLLAQT